MLGKNGFKQDKSSWNKNAYLLLKCSNIDNPVPRSVNGYLRKNIYYQFNLL